MGINSGDIVSGADGLEYTVLGDTVNTDSRLEGFAKDMLNDPDYSANRRRIFVGQNTQGLLDHSLKTRLVVETDEIKGKTGKVAIYGVIGRAEAGGSMPSGRDFD